MEIGEPNSSPDFDVIVCGGSIAGASTALLLLRRQPSLRVAIIEKSTKFAQRVGEATVEVSAYFLSKVLGLTQHLNENHLAKQGMRFWFSDDSVKNLSDCGEMGGRYLARLPSWQLDRSVLDEETLRLAVAAGATLYRPAKAIEVNLCAGGVQVVTVEGEFAPKSLSSRWVIDASGFTALLARKQGWFRRNQDHPTAAIWVRWKGVKDLDGREFADKYPRWFDACRGIRSTATNHLMGYGWWSWWIPLKGGYTSIGVVYDQRIVKPAGGPDPGTRLKTFLENRHPFAREMLADAIWVEGDGHYRANLAFSSTTTAGDGFALVGDAAGFIDPFYSPGLDWLSYTVIRAVELVAAERASDPGLKLDAEIQRHNRDFRRSYERWFEAIYSGKYEYMGDFELFRTAFPLDLGMYYLGIVSQPMKHGNRAFLNPPFADASSRIPFFLIRTYHRRLVQMARSRINRGVYGLHNSRQRFFLNGYLPENSTAWPLARAMLRWIRLELKEGWRTWAVRQTVPVSVQPEPLAPAQAPLTDGGSKTVRA